MLNGETQLPKSVRARRSVGVLGSLLLAMGSMMGIAHATGTGDIAPVATSAEHQDAEVILDSPAAVAEMPVDAEPPFEVKEDQDEYPSEGPNKVEENTGDPDGSFTEDEAEESGDNLGEQTEAPVNPEDPEDLEGAETDSETNEPAEYKVEDKEENDGAKPGKLKKATKISPLSDDDDVEPPYLTWTVRDTQGNLVPGATFNLQGQKTGGSIFNPNKWNNNVSNNITDCTESPCAGPDLDPAPGVFKVKAIGSHDVVAQNRYRLQRTGNAVAGYTWASSTDWRNLPGANNNDNSNSPLSGAWQNDTYDFGAYYLRQAGNYAPSCGAGFVYSIASDGQMRQLDPNNTVTTLGSNPGQTNMNALGVGLGGQPVYALKRDGGGQNSSVDLWAFNTSTGQWSSVKNGVSVTRNGATTGIVAGAVCLSCGQYFFGGFDSTGTQFRLWMYNSGTGEVVPKGYINTSGTGSSRSSNGDIAFDKEGTLYLVRGVGSNVTVFSVSFDSLQAATENTNLAVQTKIGPQAVTGATNINGAALDSSGNLLVGDGTRVWSYQMPGLTGGTTRTTGLTNSTDLASCSSPSTMTVRKFIQGGRVSGGDQFELKLQQGSTLIGETVTTDGPATGLQTKQLGPVPATTGVELTFSESPVGTTILANYTSSYRCYVDGVQDHSASGNGTTGTITIPSNANEVVCTFYNAPLVADVTIKKEVTDAEGQNPEAKEGWTVGSVAADPAESVSVQPPTTPTTKQTDAQGAATWQYKFSSVNDRATVTVHEDQQAGFSFARGTCEVTNLNGTVTTTALTSADPQQLPGIAPGDEIVCTYVNQPIELTTITLVKQTKDVGDTEFSAAEGWTLGAEGEGVSLPQSNSAVTNADGKAGPWVVKFDTADDSADVTLSEIQQPGFEFQSLACEGTEAQLSLDDTNPGGELSGIKPGETITCTFKNEQQPGSVIWEKIDKSNPAKNLAGSEWKLTGPGIPPGAGGVTVTDCVSTTCAQRDFEDQDPEAGKLRLQGLKWGTYSLQETKAPAGYVRDETVHNFEVGPGTGDVALEIDLGKIENEQQDAPNLPLTGGLSAFSFLLLGGGLMGGTTLWGLFLHRRRGTHVK